MRAALIALATCSSSPAPAPSPPVVPAVADAMPIDAAPPIDAEVAQVEPPEVLSDLKKLQLQLGPAKARTCDGTAKLLASQGTTTDENRAKREKSILKLCVADKWPQRVRECVAEADHDQLSCTAYLETKAQRAHFDVIFNDW